MIIDEKLGRFHAKHANLKITGTLGTLLKAKKLEYIAKIEPLLLELKKKGSWLNDNLIEKTLRLAGEN